MGQLSKEVESPNVGSHLNSKSESKGGKRRNSTVKYHNRGMKGMMDHQEEFGPISTSPDIGGCPLLLKSNQITKVDRVGMGIQQAQSFFSTLIRSRPNNTQN